MARAYNQDLRDRVTDAALAGLPARQAAVQFRIGVATAIGWVGRARRSGERTARRQGQPRRSKLDPHQDFLLGLVEATPDTTPTQQAEYQAQVSPPADAVGPGGFEICIDGLSIWLMRIGRE